MTASAQKTIDGSLISRADLERMRVEEEQHAQAMRRAAVTVAGWSTDAHDARMLFDLLGLDETVLSDARSQLHGRSASGGTAAPAAKPAKRRRKVAKATAA